MTRSHRLHFLDGLRGLAALYVGLYHEVMINDGVKGELSRPMQVVRAWLNHGHYAVIFFIVLSGFSLMMPVAKSPTGELKGGFVTFVGRRARRILPPYYAALALSLAVIVSANQLGPWLHLGAQPVEGALGAGPILSHVFLVHNLKFDWAYRINAPMWTIATEWQIYFVFALALLPLYRRAGMLVTLVVAWIVGILPFLLLPADSNFFWACPWFLGSFALGMAGAVMEFSPTQTRSWWHPRLIWPLLVLVSGIGVVVVAMGEQGDVIGYLIRHLVVSVFGFSLIGACSTLSKRTEPHIVIRLFQSTPISALGGFSYSLYLIQHPLLRLVEKGVLNRLPLGKDANLILQLLVLTPILLAISWLFADFFEKPFTTGSRLLPLLRRLARSSVGARPAPS
jgi:peptidoglycan/LPS O-acetylase OafA/YrhL